MRPQCGYLYHIQTEDNTEDHELSLHLYVFSSMKHVERLTISGFQPYFYIELPSTIPIDVWKVRMGELCRKLLFMARYHEDCTYDEQCKHCARGSWRWKGRFQFEWKRKLYHVQKTKWHCMLKMSFPTCQQRNMVFARLSGKTIMMAPYSCTLTIHEKEAPPILQFCTQYKIPTTGVIQWVSTRMTCDELQKLQQTKIVKSETMVTCPRIVGIDIEVYSPNTKRMPDASRLEDCVFQIAIAHHDEKRLLHLGPVGSMQNIKTYRYATEKELLLAFPQHIQELQPHVLVGYNIFGFDFPYLIARAKMYHIDLDISRLGWSRKPCPVKEVNWSSSAYKHQHFYFWDIDGRLSMDLLPIIRRDYKFDNYRLKTVSTHFLGETKDPVTVKDIFQSYRHFLEKKSTARRELTKVGKYCVQDALLVCRLFDKLHVWIGLSEMARICHVTIPSLYIQGQQIKVYSQIYEYCHRHQIVVQTPPKENRNTKYAGATVFPPKPGMYNWVIPFDFSSLYPTTIIAYNIDYSTIVPPSRTDIDDSECHVIEWEEHTCCQHDQQHYTTTTRPDYVKCGMHRFRFLKSPIGVVPTILQQLLDARSKTKKEMKLLSKHEVDYHILDKRQLAYKVSANSMYGAMGVQKGYLPFLPGAMCVTAKGRQSIQLASKLVQGWNGQIVYGDSVIGSTPLLLRHDECQGIMCCPIRHCVTVIENHETCSRASWSIDMDGKQRWGPVHGWSIWTDDKWQSLEYVYRHEYTKDLIHVMTSDGCVTVTTDHSLLDTHKNPLSPLEWKSKNHTTPLLSTSLPMMTTIEKNVVLNDDRTCGLEDSSSLSSVFHHYCPRKIGFQLAFFIRFSCHSLWKSESTTSRPVCELPSYILTMLSSVWTVSDIETWGPDVVQGFLHGLGFNHTSMERQKVLRFDFSYNVTQFFCDYYDCPVTEHIGWGLQCLNFLMYAIYQYQGYWTSCSTYVWLPFNSPCPSLLHQSYCIERRHSSSLMVYDVSTSNHHFQAGIGRLVVHNTDSIYCHFPEQTKHPNALWDNARRIEKNFLPHFPSPMKLVFEDKLYTKFLILTKKRYMALTCGKDGDVDQELTIRGVLLARRDSCQWIRTSYEYIIRRLFENASENEICQSLSSIIVELFYWTIPLRSFVTTKLLSQDYVIRPFMWNAQKLSTKCKDWEWPLQSPFPLDELERYARQYELPIPKTEHFSKSQWQVWEAHLKSTFLHSTSPPSSYTVFIHKFLCFFTLYSQPCHAQLAFRNALRGCPVETGSRMEFVMATPFWKSLDENLKTKVGFRIEDPLYVLERMPTLRIDIAYYIQSFQSAMDQVLSIVFGKELCQSILDIHLVYARVMKEFHQVFLSPPLVKQKKRVRRML